MYEDDIEKMNFKQLREEVRALRDGLEMFKRRYADTISNLDSDNFSKQFCVEQGKMKSQLKITAEKIESAVSKEDLGQYSTIKQTAESIQSVVSRIADIKNAEPIDDIRNATDTGKIYVVQSKNSSGDVLSEIYYYFNSVINGWEPISGDSIYTVFNQTSDGFSLKGNVVIDGSAVVTRNLKLSGNVTWNMENSPVKTQYSPDNYNWHNTMIDGDMYMQMSFDGGVNWSTSTKIVGSDGNNAEITPENVFDALTDSGATQGIFAAFVNNENQIFINAEYVQTENLACTKLYAKGYTGMYFAKLTGNIGDFGIFNSNATDETYTTNSNCIWGVRNDLNAINFYSYGVNYAGYNQDMRTYFAKGNWDFANCTNIEWGNNAPDAVFG